MRKTIKILAVILAVLILAAGGLAVWLYTSYNRYKDDPMSAFENKVNQTIEIDGTQYSGNEKIVNILLLGIDSNEEREEQSKGYRSDMMVLCSVDFKNTNMTMLSIPRDTRTTVNKLDTKTGEVTSTVTNRINAAYAFGGGPKKFGAQNAMAAVEAFISCDGKFDIPVDYFLSIDMDGMPKLAEIVGGVEVTLDRDLSGIGKKGEKVTIDKTNIDAYVRNRKTGGTDDGRAARQVDYLQAVAGKIKKMGATTAGPALFTQMGSFSKTNLGVNEVLSLCTFIADFDTDEITQYRVQGENKKIDGAWYFLADMDKLAKFIVEEYYE